MEIMTAAGLCREERSWLAGDLDTPGMSQPPPSVDSRVFPRLDACTERLLADTASVIGETFGSSLQICIPAGRWMRWSVANHPAGGREEPASEPMQPAAGCAESGRPSTQHAAPLGISDEMLEAAASRFTPVLEPRGHGGYVLVVPCPEVGGCPVVAVADAFDAMSSPRLYRGSLPPAAVSKALQHGAGSQWDSGVIKAFLHAWEDVCRLRAQSVDQLLPVPALIDARCPPEGSLGGLVLSSDCPTRRSGSTQPRIRPSHHAGAKDFSR